MDIRSSFDALVKVIKPIETYEDVVVNFSTFQNKDLGSGEFISRTWEDYAIHVIASKNVPENPSTHLYAKVYESSDGNDYTEVTTNRLLCRQSYDVVDTGFTYRVQYMGIKSYVKYRFYNGSDSDCPQAVILLRSKNPALGNPYDSLTVKGKVIFSGGEDTADYTFTGEQQVDSTYDIMTLCGTDNAYFASVDQVLQDYFDVNPEGGYVTRTIVSGEPVLNGSSLTTEDGAKWKYSPSRSSGELSLVTVTTETADFALWFNCNSSFENGYVLRCVDGTGTLYKIVAGVETSLSEIDGTVNPLEGGTVTLEVAEDGITVDVDSLLLDTPVESSEFTGGKYVQVEIFGESSVTEVRYQ